MSIQRVPSHLPFPTGFELLASQSQDSPGLLMMSSQESVKSPIAVYESQDPTMTASQQLDDFQFHNLDDAFDVGTLVDGTGDDISDAIVEFLGEQPASRRSLQKFPSINIKTEPVAAPVQALPATTSNPAALAIPTYTVVATSRVAGNDATNRRRALTPKTESANTSTRRGRRAAPKKRQKRKRSKMPEDEQKRRNCESAKRSRIKKMLQLQAAVERADRLEEENKSLRERFEAVRNLAFRLTMHVASHKNCSGCTALQAHEDIDLLTTPTSTPSNSQQLR